ncbi:hypothetical protein BC832DRAFT_543203, partial [Gaertneriomyces semiglobifer]
MQNAGVLAKIPVNALPFDMIHYEDPTPIYVFDTSAGNVEAVDLQLKYGDTGMEVDLNGIAWTLSENQGDLDPSSPVVDVRMLFGVDVTNTVIVLLHVVVVDGQVVNIDMWEKTPVKSPMHDSTPARENVSWKIRMLFPDFTRSQYGLNGCLVSVSTLLCIGVDLGWLKGL